jgi:hypothetical protein
MKPKVVRFASGDLVRFVRLSSGVTALAIGWGPGLTATPILLSPEELARLGRILYKNGKP